MTKFAVCAWVRVKKKKKTMLRLCVYAFFDYLK